MITFSSMTHSIDTRTIQKYLLILGTVTACSILLVALLFVLWLVQEVVQATIEVCHLLTTVNPLIITGLLVVVAVWLLGKVKR